MSAQVPTPDKDRCGAQPPPEAVHAQLEKILASKAFAHAGRLSRLLRYTVEETLRGQADQIKEYVLGVHVFDKGQDFDPRIDPVVRVEAHRLRSRLRKYYESDGRDAPVLIDYPKGSYVPVFRLRPPVRGPWWRARWAVLAGALVLAGLLAWLAPRELEPLAPARAVDPKAFEAYLKGRYQRDKRTKDGLRKSIFLFDQALAEDPGYALAWAGLAESYALLGSYGSAPPREVMPKAKAAAERALALDGALAEAHASLGFVKSFFEWDWQGAGQDYRRALERNPNSATARHWYAGYLRAMGRLEEAIEEIRRAQALDPLSRAIRRDLGRTLYSMRRYDEAIREYRQALEFEPDFPSGYLHLGLAYAAQGRHADALAALRKARSLPGGNPLILGGLGHCYGLMDRPSEARKILGELEALSEREYVSPMSRVFVYTGLGQHENAFQWLEGARQERDGWLAWLKVDPVFDRLRRDPRFAGLLRGVGLADR